MRKRQQNACFWSVFELVTNAQQVKHIIQKEELVHFCCFFWVEVQQKSSIEFIPLEWIFLGCCQLKQASHFQAHKTHLLCDLFIVNGIIASQANLFTHKEGLPLEHLERFAYISTSFQSIYYSLIRISRALLLRTVHNLSGRQKRLLCKIHMYFSSFGITIEIQTHRIFAF